MENANGYFQVVRSKEGTSLRLFPEKGNGQKLDINDIMSYLDYQKIDDYQLVELNKEINNLTEEKVIFISNHVGYPINEYMKITISNDRMEAKVRFYPPSNDGKRMDIDEMKGDLKALGIKYGIDERVFQVISKTPIYCTDFIVARGKKVREGTNASIEYLFNTDRRIRPKHNDDGSVDFHQLNNISHIKTGDKLAILHMADKGESGIDIMGAYINPKPVKDVKLKYGKNIKLSDDGLSIISEVNGHAILEGDRVFVSDCYDVPGDVDNSTGDIDYEGNVIIHGNVRTGFKVKATGDIEVNGSVEGAELISGGQVILHHGMQGMAKGKIIAKGNIVTKFIESARVYSGGYIEAAAIIQCQVSAKGDIRVNGQRGHIIGGHIRTLTTVEAKTIGSGMEISTVVEVGYDPELQDKIANIKKQLIDKNNEYKLNAQRAEVLNKRLKSGMIKDEQKIELKTSLVNMQTLQSEFNSLQEQLAGLEEQNDNNSQACIKVQNYIYPGTQLIVAGEYYNVTNEISYCEFRKINGEVKMQPL